MAKGKGPIRVEVRGLKAMRRAFNLLPRNLARKVIRQALRKGQKVIHAEARRRVPVDTGTLAKSIKVRAAKRTRKGRIGVVVTTGQGDSLFKGDTYYGGMVEFGTSKMPPHPFMRPAADTKGKEALNVAIQDIRAGVDREAEALRKG